MKSDSNYCASFDHALSLAVGLLRIRSRPTLVAAGGNGIVFRAIDAEGRSLAIKIPRFDLLTVDRVSIARNCLLREREVLDHVQTIHVPRLIYCDNEGIFLARDFVQGQLLETLVHDSGVDQLERLRVALQVLEAASELWQQFHEWPAGAYVIRDFKPQNLVLDGTTNRVVLIDVGSVRSESSMLSKRRRSYRIGSGSWRYWAPEQLFEDPDLLDRRADYFSLGSTLYALLYGSPPYSNAANASDFHDSYRREYLVVCRRLQSSSWLPHKLRQFMAACLSPDPDERPSMVPSALTLIAQ